MDDPTDVVVTIKGFTNINKDYTVLRSDFLIKVSIVSDISGKLYLEWEWRRNKCTRAAFTLIAIDLFSGVSTPIKQKSMDKHMPGKPMLISDCITVHTKFDHMDVSTWSFTNLDAAHFLLWMTLGSFKSYINMKES